MYPEIEGTNSEFTEVKCGKCEPVYDNSLSMQIQNWQNTNDSFSLFPFSIFIFLFFESVGTMLYMVSVGSALQQVLGFLEHPHWFD